MLRLLRSEQVILNLLAVLIGVAASVGREGPAVHIGASLASWFGPRLRLSRSLSLTLLGCGVALAVAASFFALEVEIALVVGTIVARVHLGDFPAFVTSDSALVSFLELPAFAILGLVSAAVAADDEGAPG